MSREDLERGLEAVDQAIMGCLALTYAAAIMIAVLAAVEAATR